MSEQSPPVAPARTAEVRPGDIIGGGRNFGTGSSRPGSLLLKHLGIVALVAETINGLFYRNCIS
jgi:3-isopropylmalate/(R)-2-methylmalate dehydratase small subunit